MLVTSQKPAAKEIRVKEIEGAYLLIKNHQNSFLFGHYKLGFCCLELNLFSHCFVQNMGTEISPAKNSPRFSPRSQ